VRRLVAVLAAWLALAPLTGLRAVEPGEILADPALEARARDISKGLRCLVCQNQSIDDSNADLARDLRVLVRERLTAGETDDQVVAFVTARYGDYVLLEPPFKPATYVLWLGPAAILLAGGGAVAMFLRRRRRGAAREAPPLSDDERRRIERLLDDGAGH
jgi:cytochrome c-type biogenesis protein CcmH